MSKEVIYLTQSNLEDSKTLQSLIGRNGWMAEEYSNSEQFPRFFKFLNYIKVCDQKIYLPDYFKHLETFGISHNFFTKDYFLADGGILYLTLYQSNNPDLSNILHEKLHAGCSTDFNFLEDTTLCNGLTIDGSKEQIQANYNYLFFLVDLGIVDPPTGWVENKLLGRYQIRLTDFGTVVFRGVKLLQHMSESLDETKVSDSVTLVQVKIDKQVVAQNYIDLSTNVPGNGNKVQGGLDNENNR
ncbi:MAG: hypothetical protein WAX66_02155 [Patescibacteria group bacterium]